MARKSLDEQIKANEERLKQLKAKKAQTTARETAARLARERKADTQRKIQLGGLVILSGISDLDRGQILGALLDVSSRLKTDAEYSIMCQIRGDELLEQQALLNKKSAAAQAQGKALSTAPEKTD